MAAHFVIAAIVTCVCVCVGLVSEYCELDTFSAQCSDPSQVVVIRSAHFGRMRLGRCLTVNNGNLGCQLDVLAQLEARCSGRRRCDVPVSAIDHATLACTREVRGYLEASYICVKGWRPSIIRQPSRITLSVWLFCSLQCNTLCQQTSQNVILALLMSHNLVVPCFS